MRLLLPLLLIPALASAQTLPLRLPQFADPPEANGANPITYPHGIIYNPTLLCVQGTVGASWECLARVTQVAAVAAAAAAAQAAAEDAATAAANAQSTANSAATSASNAQTTANSAQSAATNAGTAAAAAQSSAASAASAASSAQAAANTNATAITALQSTVAAIPRRVCNTASVTGLSIPLLGISTTSTVTVTGAPVGTSCDVGVPSFLPLGSKAEAAVLTAGTASLRFVSNTGLLSGIISIPNGTYRVCCDL